jgi:hypothetical protein
LGFLADKQPRASPALCRRFRRRDDLRVVLGIVVISTVQAISTQVLSTAEAGDLDATFFHLRQGKPRFFGRKAAYWPSPLP